MKVHERLVVEIDPIGRAESDDLSVELPDQRIGRSLRDRTLKILLVERQPLVTGREPCSINAERDQVLI